MRAEADRLSGRRPLLVYFRWPRPPRALRGYQGAGAAEPYRQGGADRLQSKHRKVGVGGRQ